MELKLRAYYSGYKAIDCGPKGAGKWAGARLIIEFYFKTLTLVMAAIKRDIRLHGGHTTCRYQGGVLIPVVFRVSFYSVRLK